MAANLAASGNNLALEITHTFPPKYWKKEYYGNKQYIKYEVDSDSIEYYDLKQEIQDAQENNGNAFYDNIEEINRIQNPYSYARFMLRKKYLYMSYGKNKVYQQRKYKLIREKYVDLALKYNCDVRRFGKRSANYRFFDEIPGVWQKYCLIVVQQLIVELDDDSEDESESDDDDNIECDRESEFYIEYVVYFDV